MQTDRATLIAWHVTSGDHIDEGDVIAEIETEKATAEIDAKESGVLRRIYAREGDVAEPGDPLGIVAGANEDISELEAKAERDGAERIETARQAADTGERDTTAAVATEDESSDTTDSEQPTQVSPRAKRRAEELDVDLATIEGSGPGGAITEDDVTAAAEANTTDDEAKADIKATPRAKQRAAELDVDLSTIEGSGPGGAIVAEDVEAVGATEGTAPKRTLRDEQPLSEMRRTIADRLGQSYRESVHVTVHREADAESLLTAVEIAQQEVDPDVSVIDIVLLALSATLETYPKFNATFEDGSHRVYEEHNIGLAVDLDHGLITPVLANVGEMSLTDLVAERQRLTERALSGEYTPAELRGGTFTVTNLGPFAIESFTPIINPPEVAILGVDSTVERAQRGADDGVEFRRMLPLDLSFDHRVVDGADAARFLDTLVDHLETPWSLVPDTVADARDEVTDGSLPERTLMAHTASGYKGTVRAGSFEWKFDEPPDIGGTGSAPTPVDMFLGSLAACLSASIRFQADKHQIDLDGIDVSVDGSPERGPLQTIEATVTLDGNGINEEKLDRIIELGKQECYVSKLLGEEVELDVSWTTA